MTGERCQIAVGKGYRRCAKKASHFLYVYSREWWARVPTCGQHVVVGKRSGFWVWFDEMCQRFATAQEVRDAPVR